MCEHNLIFKYNYVNCINHSVSVGEFSQAITDVPVPANITNGTIATINVLLDQNILSDNQARLSFIASYIRVRGDQIIHDRQPEVELSILSTNLNLSNNFMDGNYLDFSIMNLNVNSLADCGKYKILPLQLNLDTPSINQLGEHVVYISGSIVNESTMMEFLTVIVLDVETSTCEYRLCIFCFLVTFVFNKSLINIVVIHCFSLQLVLMNRTICLIY